MATISLQSMTMEFTLQAPDGEPRDLAERADHVQQDLDWVNAVFSTYRDDSWISRISRGEALVADAPPAVATVLELCEEFRVRTGGAFDGTTRGGGAGFNGTPGRGIDPTGIVKTWALERVRWRWGQENYLWGCGGDAIAVGHNGGKPFTVGIDDPRAPRSGQMVDAVRLTGTLTCIATSGMSQHAGHIWNPATGEVAGAYDQVSVIGPDLIAADAWATAIVAGGPDTARAAIAEGFEVLTLRVVDGDVASSRSAKWPSLR